jgi:transcription antitermination factor NusG
VRLQLSEASLEEYARQCGQVTGDFEADVSRIFAVFVNTGHRTFTRKDVTYVLIRMGQTEGLRGNTLCWETSDLWERLGKAISSVAEKETDKRGYWTFSQGAAPPAAPVASPEPEPPAKDVRDVRTWVAIELSPMGEYAASRGELDTHLTSLFPSDVELFIPYVFYYQDGRRELFNVMEGYCFVESGLDDRDYLAFSHESPYLKKVLHSRSNGSLALHTIPDAKVQELKDTLAQKVAVEIKEGMEVEVTRGLYRGLRGHVVGVSEEHAGVLFAMRSLNTIRSIPRYLLMPIGDLDE